MANDTPQGLDTIRARRLALKPKITYQELADESGCSIVPIRNIEIKILAGKKPNPKVQTAEAILSGLDRVEIRRAEHQALTDEQNARPKE